MSGILWVLCTGAPRRDVPERFGKWATVYCRFRRWTARGVWQRVFDELRRLADQEGRLDRTKHFVDGTVVRAHVRAAGARGGQEGEALGRSRGGFSTKIHLRAEGNGKPFAFVLSGVSGTKRPPSNPSCASGRFVEADEVDPSCVRRSSSPAKATATIASGSP